MELICNLNHGTENYFGWIRRILLFSGTIISQWGKVGLIYNFWLHFLLYHFILILSIIVEISNVWFYLCALVNEIELWIARQTPSSNSAGNVNMACASALKTKFVGVACSFNKSVFCKQCIICYERIITHYVQMHVPHK